MAARKKTDLPAELDADRLAQLEQALAAERERRDAELMNEQIAKGRVTRIVRHANLGESEAEALAKAGNPKDCAIIMRVIFDAPEPPEVVDGRPSNSPVYPIFDEAQSKVDEALSRRIIYPDLGLA